MIITLRKCLSEAIRVDKQFATNTDKAYEGTFRGEISILHPVFNIQTTDDLTMYNYAEITAFGRKYFAKIRAIAYSIWEISCDVDALSTYATGIRASKALVKRTAKESKVNYYMNDGAFYTEQRTITTYHTFKKNGARAKLGTTDYYYLLVAGG